MTGEILQGMLNTDATASIANQLANGYYGTSIALLGAAIAISLAGVGSAIGVSMVANTGSGLLREKPELYGKILLLVVLPGTQGIYGFLGAFWVMLKLNILSGNPYIVSTGVGYSMLWGSLPVAITGLFSAIYQAKVAASGMGVIAKDSNNVGKAVILAAMVETYAVLGLLVTILIINGLKIG